MVKKFVRYKGGFKDYHPFPQPLLSEMHIYEVVNELEFKSHTAYTLKGINGLFNSQWFSEVKVIAHTGISNQIPVVGQTYEYSEINMDYGFPRCLKYSTSAVDSFTDLGNNIYEIYAKYHRFIILVK